MKTSDLPHRQPCDEWSNRIVLLSLLGIAYLTLFPFRIDFSPSTVSHQVPFLLRGLFKPTSDWDFLLNVLLFVPFGFGISAQARKREAGRRTSLLLALAAGACVSYLVELLQFYIPGRDSGWEDVFSNTTGSVAGYLLFGLCGDALLERLSRWEEAAERWLPATRITLLLLAYFVVCFGISAWLQKETRLNNWDPLCLLSVGNDASGYNPWKGQIYRLQIWDRALSDEAARRIASSGPLGEASAGLLGSYEFAGSPPYSDQTHFLPPLDWIPQRPPLTGGSTPESSAGSWMSTGAPVENLMQAVMKSGQFTVHIVCRPATDNNVNGRIIAFSRSAGIVNFLLREEGPFLVFRLRTPVSSRHTRSGLAWYIPGAFQPGTVRDIVASYDGADEFVYLDGKRVARNYRLGPAASLARKFRFIQTEDLEAYIILYETLLFLPAGVLLGMAARNWSAKPLFNRWMLALGCVLPPALLEFLLVAVSGRRVWVENIALSLTFVLAGMLLINADQRFKHSGAAS
jgi:glycopeptide antibiotics resistance protein